MATSIQVVMDCHDPDRLARFWARALHYKLQDPPEGYVNWEQWLSAMGIPEDQWNDASAVVDPDGRGPRIYFQRVPEAKSVKNRLHLDLNVGGSHGTALEVRRERVDAEVQRLAEAGATKSQAMDLRGEYWVVMGDPEGNEFCVH
jgi:hypothetical protein